MNSLLGNVGTSDLSSLLQAYQKQNWAPMVLQAQQQAGSYPAAAANPAATGYMPFGFQPPQVPQSQFQPYQSSTGQAYGLNPMQIFQGDVTASRNLYNALGNQGGTTPPPDDGTGGTTPPPAVPGLPPGVTQEQWDQLQRLLYPREGEHPMSYSLRTRHSERRLPGLLEGMPDWYANLVRGSNQYAGIMNPTPWEASWTG
jgi:hypothetical protein